MEGLQYQDKYALIVEDDQFNFDVLSTMLKRLGIESTFSTSNQELDDLLATNPTLDIIFVDLEMPGRNGYDVLKLLRENPRYKNTPIVAYTTHEELLDETASTNFDSFLINPIDRHQFPEIMKKIMNGETVYGSY